MITDRLRARECGVISTSPNADLEALKRDVVAALMAEGAREGWLDKPESVTLHVDSNVPGKLVEVRGVALWPDGKGDEA